MSIKLHRLPPSWLLHQGWLAGGMVVVVADQEQELAATTTTPPAASTCTNCAGWYTYGSLERCSLNKRRLQCNTHTAVTHCFTQRLCAPHIQPPPTTTTHPHQPTTTGVCGAVNAVQAATALNVTHLLLSHTMLTLFVSLTTPHPTQQQQPPQEYVELSTQFKRLENQLYQFGEEKVTLAHHALDLIKQHQGELDEVGWRDKNYVWMRCFCASF